MRPIPALGPECPAVAPAACDRLREPVTDARRPCPRGPAAELLRAVGVLLERSPPERTPVRRKGARLGIRFAGHRGGASAVEFAILAAPFLMLLCLVAETGFVALAQQTLDLALDRGVRQFRTGAFQDGADGSDPIQRFRRVVCSSPVFFPCANLKLDVSRAASFSASRPTEPFDRKTKTWTQGFGTRFDCPQSGDVVTVRVAVPVLRLFRFLDFTGRIMADRTQLLISTAIFQAETYESKPC